MFFFLSLPWGVPVMFPDWRFWGFGGPCLSKWGFREGGVCPKKHRSKQGGGGRNSRTLPFPLFGLKYVSPSPFQQAKQQERWEISHFRNFDTPPKKLKYILLWRKILLKKRADPSLLSSRRKMKGERSLTKENVTFPFFQPTISPL